MEKEEVRPKRMKTSPTMDDILESQIGSAGGEMVENKEQPSGLGKLQHASEILGQRATLSPEEQEALDAFRSHVRTERQERAESIQIGDGWIPVDRNEMGIRGDFYPASWEFYIKPAAVSAIKNWTSVDETNTQQVNNVLNEIIRTSVRIDTHGEGTGGWGQINSWDRFWFVLKVRECTFAKGESKVEFEDQCTECGADLTYVLTSSALHYEFPDDDLIEKYWDGTQWNIDPAEYDVDHEPVILYTPKLGRDARIIEWATAQARARKNIDENFVRFLMWMLPNPSRDLNVLNRQIEKIYKEYKSWSIEMYGFMDDVIRNLTVNPSENLKMTCPSCGQEVLSTVRFPDGIQVLFRTARPAKKFGSR